MARKKEFAEFFIFALLDAVFLLLVLQVSIFFRADFLPAVFDAVSHYSGAYDLTLAGLLVPLWVLFLMYEGVYTRKMFFWDEVVVLWKSSVVVPVLMFFVVSVLKISEDISRFVILFSGVLSFVFFPFYKGLVKAVLRRYGVGVVPVIIVGAGEGGVGLLEAIRKEHSSGYVVAGFVDKNSVRNIDGIKVYRRIDRLERYLRFSGVRDIFVVESDIGRETTDRLVKAVQHRVKRLIVIPELQGLPVVGTELHYFFYSQIVGIEVKNNLDNPVNRLTKMLFDVAVAVLLLPFFLLLSIFIVIAIILDSPGSPVFTQLRVGKDGRLFKIYKFRTMHKDADKILAEYFEKNPSAKQEYEKYWKLRDDPRVTRVGRVLRKLSLDELPQLINVLKGEMSLVGPRPYLPHELEFLGDSKNIILRVRPGITGLWQVSGRSNTDYTYRVSLDSWYVRNWSVWIDLIILYKTFEKVVKREGAY